MGFGGESGGSGSISGSSDVALNNPANNEVLTYDSSVNLWKNAPPQGDGSVSLADLPAGSVIFASGSTTARPSSRTDLRCIWTADSEPINALDDDIWMNSAA